MDLETRNITAAGDFEGEAVTGLGKLNGLSLQVAFTYVASSATSVKVYVQTSLDGGNTWIDIACFAFTTSSAVKMASVVGATAVAPAAITNGALSDNTCQHGILGDRIRLRTVVVGTYGSGTQAKATYFPR